MQTDLLQGELESAQRTIKFLQTENTRLKVQVKSLQFQVKRMSVKANRLYTLTDKAREALAELDENSAQTTNQ